MKTDYRTSMKDNVASGLVLAAIFIFAVASMSTSFATPASPVVQKMETIVVTAKRVSTNNAVYKMDKIVVSAPRIRMQVAAAETPPAI